MLGNFPKLFDKNFVIGFLLPVILALVTFAWLFPDLALLRPLRSIGATESSLGGLTYLALAAYGLAILLVMTNTLQYRLLEGYLPPLSRWNGGRRTQEARRKALADAVAADETRWSEGELSPSGIGRLAQLKVELTGDFPPLDQEALPTRFGNAIRAFESYPLEAYGADGTPIWLRLASVISKEFANELEDARAQVNFLLNLLYILPIVAIAALWKAFAATPWAALVEVVPADRVADWYPQPAFVVGIAAILLAWPTYAFLVERTKAWGDVVKAAFDCYLPALIGQLGYAEPTTDAARRALWREISALIVYRQPLTAGAYELASPPEPTRALRLDLPDGEEEDQD